MHKGVQKRSYVRFSASCQFRVTTSLSRISYGVEVKNISRGGAFIITNHTPPVGEVINVEVLDRYGRTLFNCSSQIKSIRSISNEFGHKSGLGIQFTEVLTDNQLEQLAEG